MIKRKLYHSLQQHLAAKEISFIVGPRQAGKTTLMQSLQEELVKKGEKTLYLNMDIEADRRYFASQADLVDKISLEIGENRGYVFLDEVQRKENVGLFLKGIYDMNLAYKFIVSGSGSVELKAKIHESLTGRKRMFELSTISFEEFINFKTNSRYEDKLQEFFAVEHDYTQRLLDEYMRFGGYPRVIMAETVEEKTRVMREIYEGYIEKDIGYLLGVENIDAFSNLVRLIASQIGNLVNVTELSSTLGISAVTVKNYLWYLENTYIIQRITPFFRNMRKEITKSPIFYFYDLGFCNYARSAFGQSLVDRAYSGFLFENFVYNFLKESIHSPARIHFWRSKDNAEVDFVVNAGLDIIPIETKHTALNQAETSRSFKSFLIKYHPKRAYIIHLGGKMETIFDSTAITFLPYYESVHVT